MVITELSQLDPNGHYTYADYLTTAIRGARRTAVG
jgi:hypothetical protein